MKVKLLYPPRLRASDIHQYMPRLGIGLIYSYLKLNGIDVEQDDLAIKCFNTKELMRKKINLNIFNNEKRIEDYLKGRQDAYLEYVLEKILNLTDYKNAGLIGFSITETPQYLVSLCLAKKLKKIYNRLNKKIYIVFGGPSITLKRGYSLKNYSFIDFEIIGDGEIPLLKLVNALENASDKDKPHLNEIPNLMYRDDTKIQQNEVTYYDINELPRPDFDGLPINLYKKNGVLVLPYSFFRGCAAKCAFCTHRLLSDKLRIKEISIAISEIKELSMKYGTRYFMFCENAVNISNDFVSKLCDAIIENNLNIMWMSWARPEKMTGELLRKMRKAGCIKLDFGVESGNQQVLNLINKGFAVENSEDVLRATSEAGIWVHTSFMVNFVNEGEREFKDTVDFVNRNSIYFDSMEENIFTLNSGSDISSKPGKYGINNVNFGSGIGLYMSYSTEHTTENEIREAGLGKLKILIQTRVENKISKLIDPIWIFDGFAKFNSKDKAKEYLANIGKYPILV